MTRVLRLVLVAAAAVALVLASDTSTLAHDDTGHLAGGHTARLAVSLDYVALGDSYSAGPLIPAQRRDPTGCFRSTNNYPAFLAGYLDVTTYRDVACSGARVRDFAKRQTPALGAKVPPQLAALSATTDLVTVGIGGNDFGLFGSLTTACCPAGDEAPDTRPRPARGSSPTGTA